MNVMSAKDVRQGSPDEVLASGEYPLTRRDLTEIAAQVPALVEALSGVPMADLVSRVRKIGDNKPAGV